MERLTKRNKQGVAYLVVADKLSKKEREIEGSKPILEGIYATFQKLAKYEDTGLEPQEIIRVIKSGVPEWIGKYVEYRKLEEQGLLIKSPCKVNDMVYWINPFKSGINQGKIEFLNINKFGFDLAIMGQEGVLIRRELEKVFLTREEAEKVLKEREVTNE